MNGFLGRYTNGLIDLKKSTNLYIMSPWSD